MFESYEMICGDCGDWEETLVDDVTGEGLGICGPCYDQNVVGPISPVTGERVW